MVQRLAGKVGWVVLLVASSPWVALGETSTAPTATPKASELRIAAERFDEGRAAYKAQAFAEAAEHFEAADRQAPSASALGLAMRSREQAGQLLRAANLAELVRIRYPENTELVAKADAVLEAAKAAGAKVDIECRPACDLVVDQRLTHGQMQERWVLHLEPGQHVITANWASGRAETRQLALKVGESQLVSLRSSESRSYSRSSAPATHPGVELKPGPEEAGPEKERRKLIPPTLFWIGVGATALVSGATIWSGVDTMRSPGRNAVSERCTNLGSGCELYQEGQRKELRTNVLIGATAAVAIATAVTGIFFTDFSRKVPSSGKQASQLQLRPWVHSSSPVESSGQLSPLGRTTLVGAEGRF